MAAPAARVQAQSTQLPDKPTPQVPVPTQTPSIVPPAQPFSFQVLKEPVTVPLIDQLEKSHPKTIRALKRSPIKYRPGHAGHR
jgi:hypothetical protein